MLHQIWRARSGVVALEYGIVALFMFALIFGIFDVGRYAITLHQMSVLADEAARKQIICYGPYTARAVTSVACSSDPLNTTTKQAMAPFVPLAGLSITTAPLTGAGPRTVTVSLTGFNMFFVPITVDNPLVVTADLPF